MTKSVQIWLTSGATLTFSRVRGILKGDYVVSLWGTGFVFHQDIFNVKSFVVRNEG